MEILDKKSNRMSRVKCRHVWADMSASWSNFLETLSNLLLRVSYDADSWFFIVKKFTQ